MQITRTAPAQTIRIEQAPLKSETKDQQSQTIPTRCDAMNIKWATLTVGALFGFAHIGI